MENIIENEQGEVLWTPSAAQVEETRLAAYMRWLEPEKRLRFDDYEDTIAVHTNVEEWRGKVFIQHHRVMRGDELICEGRETRALCIKLADGGLKAVPVPDKIRTLCS